MVDRARRDLPSYQVSPRKVLADRSVPDRIPTNRFTNRPFTPTHIRRDREDYRAMHHRLSAASPVADSWAHAVESFGEEKDV